MRITLISFLAGLLALILMAGSGQALLQSEPIPVDASELDRLADLVGKVVAVDDRVRFYHWHPGQGYDELYLKRTTVVFRLPPALRPKGSPSPMPVLVQGRLGREAGQIVCDVTTLKILPSDLQRLDKAVSDLGAKDFQNRKSWAEWAERRGKAFKDSALLQKGRSLEADAWRVEAELKRATVDAPREWLALAEEARRRNIAEPEPSALAHKAFRARLAAASRSDAIQDLLSAIERFFPRAATDQASGRTDLTRWNQAYTNDPGASYRSAPANIRRGLDRKLWTDGLEKLLEAQAAEDPHSAVRLAARAESDLPERPPLAAKLLNRGLDSARQNLSSLRRDEVMAIAQAYREKLQNPQAATDLYREWLKNKRDKLSETDADGPVALASLYEELLQDKTAARELLERAWKIDPGSEEVAEAFRTRGYRLVKDQWVEAGSTAAPAPSSVAGDGAPKSPLFPSAQGLRGQTHDEVLQEIGSKPDRKALSGTKGQLIEQWIFLVPTRRQVHFVNFLRTPGDLQPRVVSDYFLPSSAIIGELKPVR